MSSVKQFGVRHTRRKREHEERVCIICGCTDSQACPGGCSWAVKYPDGNTGVCSQCYPIGTDGGGQ
jgi:hypothetical protein